jgi:hypothetical protein
MKKSNIVKLNSWNKSNFVQELDILNSGVDFYFNDVLINNIDDFFNFVGENKIDKINLHKFDEIDIILVRKAMKFFNNFYKQFLELNIKFLAFNQDELISLLSEELYFLYCNKFNIKYCKSLKLINDEKNKLNKFSNSLFKYVEFDIIYKFYKNTDRFCYFNFPIEVGLDRFVFYFLINTRKDKDEILKLFDEINLNTDCVDIFNKIGVCENGSLFAIGFNYKNQLLDRTTIYSRLNVFSKNDINTRFLNKYFNLSQNGILKIIKDEKLFVKDYGIDCFNSDNSKNILKLYFKETNFLLNNFDSELIRVLENKPCVACYKICDAGIVDKKYEFSNNLFNENEILVLEKYKIFDKKARLFSVYFDFENKYKTSVSYNI